MKCKDGGSSFYKNEKYRWLGEKKLDYLISEISNFSYMHLLRKGSMFRRNIPPINQFRIFFFFLCINIYSFHAEKMKNDQTTLKILRCSHHLSFKVCLTII